jgi:hypothetical protein
MESPPAERAGTAAVEKPFSAREGLEAVGVLSGAFDHGDS